MGLRRGLVIVGGGAKGAYSLGAMQALSERSFVFEAVSGTSAGALNAAVWATRDLAAGEVLWSRMRPESSYDRHPFLKLLPRPLSRLLGTISVVTSLFMTRLAGSPIDGKHEGVIDFILFFIPLVFSALVCLVLALLSAWQLLEFAAVGIPLSFLFGPLLLANDMDFAKGRKHKNIIAAALVTSGVLAPYILFLLHERFPGITLDIIPGILIYLILVALLAGTITTAVHFTFSPLFSIRVMTSEPLRKTLNCFLADRPLLMPLYVTAATGAYIFDPDNPTWIAVDSGASLMASDYIGPWEPHATFRWLPRYVRIDQRPLGDAVEHLLATAALPFGIIGAVTLNGISCVDGGVIDNIPILPLLEHGLDEIIVLHLSPLKIGVAEDDLHERRCADLIRLLSLEDLHLPPQTKVRPNRILDERREPTIVPLPKIEVFPNLRIFRPSRSLGGVFSGLLNFTPAYATKLIALGRSETLAQIDRLSDRAS